MSKGIKGAIAGLALLGLGVFLCASPASAQGTDNLDPSPVGEVLAEFNEGGRSITVAWTLSDDDVVRQVPTSSDFTTGWHLYQGQRRHWVRDMAPSRR